VGVEEIPHGLAERSITPRPRLASGPMRGLPRHGVIVRPVPFIIVLRHRCGAAEIVYAVASQVQPAIRARGQAMRARTTSPCSPRGPAGAPVAASRRAGDLAAAGGLCVVAIQPARAASFALRLESVMFFGSAADARRHLLPADGGPEIRSHSPEGNCRFDGGYDTFLGALGKYQSEAGRYGRKLDSPGWRARSGEPIVVHRLATATRSA
jgi:hypothetical protein